MALYRGNISNFFGPCHQRNRPSAQKSYRQETEWQRVGRKIFGSNVKDMFQRLPTEIIQYIAYLLPSDADVANFSLCSTHLANKILPAESSIWRKRFEDLYDLNQDLSSTALKIEYQIRSIVLPQKINFKNGQAQEQTLWLEVIKDMLLETFTLPAQNGQSTSKSLEQIRKVLADLDFLNRPVNGYSQSKPDPPSDLFCAVQLCLTDVALDPSMSFRCLRTDYDIGVVYSYEADIVVPLIDTEKLDLEKILHIRNFWLRHLLNPHEATFSGHYSNLPESHRPEARRSRANDSWELSTLWLGHYSCIHPYPETLSALENRQTCAEAPSLCDWEQEPMSFQFTPDPNPLNWPTLFESIICTLSPESHRSYFRGIQKFYGSDDESTFPVRGFTELIPTPQGGFPDWRRICFAIYDANREQLPLIPETDSAGNENTWLPEEEWPPLDLEMDFTWIHGYEGVMLPSGRIMMGRWIDMMDTTTRGPFIPWDL